MKKKTFNYKGQAINYYKKVRENESIKFRSLYFDALESVYVVAYNYH